MSGHLTREEELPMNRVFELASLGRGQVSPNPMVGCVIVHNSTIIAEGYHARYGEAHAEAVAISRVADASVLRDCTLYVNLEPCSHFGKTPPCADLLVRHRVKKVVIANEDSNPLVKGTGIKKLQEAGIQVVTGVLAERGRDLNRRFFTFMEKQRPYIILKWAQTADGFIAREDFSSRWISDAYSRQLVHKWRTEEDAILVGTHTAQLDNPQLNARDWSGKNPVRIVIDRNRKLPQDLHLFDGSSKTLCYNLLFHDEQPHTTWVKLNGENFLQELVSDLWKRNIQSVIVEGGASTLNAFIHSGLWDEARVFISPQTFGKGLPAPKLHATVRGVQQLKADCLEIYRNPENR